MVEKFGAKKKLKWSAIFVKTNFVDAKPTYINLVLGKQQ